MLPPNASHDAQIEAHVVSLLQDNMLSMAIYFLLIGFWSPMPTLAGELFRMPVTHVVPTEQRVLQLEAGFPVKAVRRSRMELLRVSL